MMYNKDDVIYILENNTTIRKGKIAPKQGENYIIQLIGSCGALTIHICKTGSFRQLDWAIGIGFRVVEDIRNRQQDIEKALSEE